LKPASIRYGYSQLQKSVKKTPSLTLAGLRSQCNDRGLHHQPDEGEDDLSSSQHRCLTRVVVDRCDFDYYSAAPLEICLKSRDRNTDLRLLLRSRGPPNRPRLTVALACSNLQPRPYPWLSVCQSNVAQWQNLVCVAKLCDGTSASMSTSPM
jgi:hypothetical protein